MTATDIFVEYVHNVEYRLDGMKLVVYDKRQNQLFIVKELKIENAIHGMEIELNLVIYEHEAYTRYKDKKPKMEDLIIFDWMRI